VRFLLVLVGLEVERYTDFLLDKEDIDFHNFLQLEVLQIEMVAVVRKEEVVLSRIEMVEAGRKEIVDLLRMEEGLHIVLLVMVVHTDFQEEVVEDNLQYFHHIHLLELHKEVLELIIMLLIT